MITWNWSHEDCKNEWAIFTCLISLTGPFNIELFSGLDSIQYRHLVILKTENYFTLFADVNNFVEGNVITNNNETYIVIHFLVEHHELYLMINCIFVIVTFHQNLAWGKLLLATTTYKYKIKALLGMLARLSWGRRDMLGSTNGKHGGVSVKYVSLTVFCHWIKSIDFKCMIVKDNGEGHVTRRNKQTNKYFLHYKQLNTFDHPHHIHKYLDSESSTFLLVNRYSIFNKFDKHAQLHMITIYTGALTGQGPQAWHK